MSDDREPVEIKPQTVSPLSHQRILVIMAVLGLLGSIAGFVLLSARFGFGVLIGSILAFVNYYWLKSSLKGIFDKAAYGDKPRFRATHYILRYFVFGIVLAVVYLTETVPVVAVILGLAGFGFAVVVEGIIRIILGFWSEPPA